MININESIIKLPCSSHSLKINLKINTLISDEKEVGLNLFLIKKVSSMPEEILQSLNVRLLPDDLTYLILALEAARGVLRLNYNIKEGTQN